MKRDIELIRTILNKVADEAEPDQWYYVNIPDRDQKEVIYHLRLLYQAGLITVIDTSSKDGEQYAVTGLSWQGHEFVEVTKSETIWNKTTEQVKKIGGSFTFDLLKDLAVKIASDLLMK
ncbi:DUF2513 domain-containing protein [Pedobacter panaciterrae]|uniref:DUF2513 domain-containing protein n=1 Tax=Pedobacter panaciterrae TaxID=363849 RepID=UPI00259687A6|nr:DUF2513 domain-containing protein [uncultured Pedobacter sp.]